MNKFLDTSIIIGYAGFIEEKQKGEEVKGQIDLVSRKCVEFADKKQGKFIVCYFTIDKEIFSLIKRTGIIIKEIKKKLENPDYEIGSSREGKELYKQDIIRANKYLTLKEILSNKNIKLINFLMEFQQKFEFRIDFFIKKFIDKKVIPIKEIDFELKSSLFTYLQNHSDACIIASGIQQNQIEELIMVTGDKEHWTKENLEWAVPEGSNLKKKYLKIPRIVYVQDI